MKIGAYKSLWFEYRNGRLNFVHLRKKSFHEILTKDCMQDEIRLEKWVLLGKKYERVGVVYENTNHKNG